MTYEFDKAYHYFKLIEEMANQKRAWIIRSIAREAIAWMDKYPEAIEARAKQNLRYNEKEAKG